MHIIAIAWGFVVVLMTLTEATSPQGTVLGAFFTFLLYGVIPLSVVLYILGTPMRRRARAAEEASLTSANPDRGRVAPGDAIPPVGKES